MEGDEVRVGIEKNISDVVVDGLSWMYKMHIQMSMEVKIKLVVEDADVVVSFRAGCIWCRIPASQHGSYAATPKYKYKPIQAEIQTQIYTEYNNNCQLKIAMNQKWTVAW